MTEHHGAPLPHSIFPSAFFPSYNISWLKQINIFSEQSNIFTADRAVSPNMRSADKHCAVLYPQKKSTKATTD